MHDDIGKRHDHFCFFAVILHFHIILNGQRRLIFLTGDVELLNIASSNRAFLFFSIHDLLHFFYPAIEQCQIMLQRITNANGTSSQANLQL